MTPAPAARQAPPLVGVWIGTDDSAWTLRLDGTFGAVLPSGETRRGQWRSAGDALTLAPTGSSPRPLRSRWRVSEDEKTLILAPGPFSLPGGSQVVYRRGVVDDHEPRRIESPPVHLDESPGTLQARFRAGGRGNSP